MVSRSSDPIIEEQAALRRVATLVARGAGPEDVFASVAEEVGRLLAADLMAVARFDPEGTVTVMGAWNRTSSALAVRVGGRVELGGRNATTQVFETGRPARVDHTTDATGPIARVGQEWGSRSSVAVPVSVEGRLWGVMNLTSQSTPLPPDAEARLAGFTELVAMAIANAQARIELRTFAEEQASLRRVATLVARGAQPDELFAAVTEEVGRVLASDYTALSRYEPDGTVTVMGAWNGTGSDLVVPVGGRVDLGGRNAATQVFETGQPARIDHTDATGAPADLARLFGSRSTVGVPINVEGRLWGVMNVFSTHQEPLPADTEARLAGFTDLIATAIANADAQAAFAQSQDRHRRAESQFKDFFELSPDLLCIAGDDGYLKRVNPAFEQTLGYSSEELLSMPFLEFVHPDDRARTGEMLALAGRREVVQFENRFIRKDGSERWLQWNSRPASDESLLVYAAARDITVSRRAREQQAALRRVATLVARGVAPTEVFDAVTAELRDLMSADLTGLLRYEADRTATLLAVHAGPGVETPTETRVSVDGESAASLVLRTGRPTRLGGAPRSFAAFGARRIDTRVGAPIVVESRVWGAIVAAWSHEHVSTDTESRMAEFGDLVATSIANADTRAELAASRARVLVAADDARRRIERDLHDGVQQRLVTLGLQLSAVEDAVPDEFADIAEGLSSVKQGLTGALDDLREISHGIHPAILSRGGLAAALRMLARRCALPVELQLKTELRLPERIEVTAYYLVAEALTNVVKHAQASFVRIELTAEDATLTLVVHDDGIGGADSSRGSGLMGLTDRVEAIGGRVTIASPAGDGTTVLAAFPLAPTADQGFDIA